MPLTMLSGPALEPVSLAEAKALLRVDGNAEDPLIQSLIITSRLHIEAALGLALLTQRWRLTLDAWPAGDALDLPLRPVQSIEAVRVSAGDGSLSLVPATDFGLDPAGAAPRLVRVGTAWPAPQRRRSGIEIDLVAGYGAGVAQVPQPIRHALLLLVAHWYEHRDPIEIGAEKTRVPEAVSALLEPYRVKRL